MHQLVIARYKEDLAWLTRVPANFAVHIYNKGAPITDAAVLARAATTTNRPNAGRESETYLTHAEKLVTTPSTPGDYVVFAQGDPFEHSPDFLGLLKETQNWADIQPLSWRWKVARQIPPPAVLARETAAYINGLRIRPEHFSLQTWTPLGFHDVGTLWLQETYRAVHALPDGSNIAAHFLAMCGLPALAAQADANLLGTFAYGAVFAARQSAIRAIPPDALSALRRAALGHEVYGYVLERLWLHLFGMGFTLPALLPPGAIGPLHVDGPSFLPPDPTTPRQRKVRRLLRRVLGR